MTESKHTPRPRALRKSPLLAAFDAMQVGSLLAFVTAVLLRSYGKTWLFYVAIAVGAALLLMPFPFVWRRLRPLLGQPAQLGQPVPSVPHGPKPTHHSTPLPQGPVSLTIASRHVLEEAVPGEIFRVIDEHFFGVTYDSADHLRRELHEKLGEEAMRQWLGTILTHATAAEPDPQVPPAIDSDVRSPSASRWPDDDGGDVSGKAAQPTPPAPDVQSRSLPPRKRRDHNGGGASEQVGEHGGLQAPP